MSKSLEDVLLITNNVKNKKCEGSLYMMSERMAWMPSGKDTFTVSHRYADIKVQKISPDTKDKIQLQVVFSGGGANTFHFANPAGRSEQAANREAVKELLQQMLPRFKPRINNELAEKNRLLQSDPHLFRLYKELVVSEMMTADEFWANRAAKLKTAVEREGQEVGVSAAFLADVRGQSDGCNGVKYNVTTEIMRSIFRTYPAVQQKHAEYVPDQMSEEDFWKQFFQSHYFHRDRINIQNKELFADCAHEDEKTVEREMVKFQKNSIVNLDSMSDYTLGEEYSNKFDASDVSTSQTNKSLIKRFNQHSTLVLKTCDKKRRVETDAAQSSTTTTNRSSNGRALTINNRSNATATTTTTITSEDDIAKASKQAKIQEMIGMADLEDELPTTSGPTLTLSRLDPYLHGPTPVVGVQYKTSDELLQASQAFIQDMLAWNPNPSQIFPSTVANSVLWELSPGGALMQNYSTQHLNSLASSDVETEVKMLYNALAELLRHFWACFPTTSKELEEKVVRMNESLQRFQKSKLVPFSSKHYSSVNTKHMEGMLEVAFKKFENWQIKRQTKRS